MNELKALRERAGVSQVRLAELSGVAQPNIAAYETGRRKLSPAMLVRLRQALIRPSELLDMHRAEVREIVHANNGSCARVFGSVARGDDRPDSDLDIIVRLSDDSSLFDLARMHLSLEDLLGIRVDVLEEGGLTSKHREILADAVAL